MGRGVTAPPEEPLRDEFCAPSKGQTPNNEVPNQGAGLPKAGQTPAGGGIARQHCTGRAGDPHGRAQPGGGYRPPARPAFEGRPAVPPFPSRLGPRGSGLPSRPPLSGRLQGGPAAPRCRRRPRPARREAEPRRTRSRRRNSRRPRRGHGGVSPPQRRGRGRRRRPSDGARAVGRDPGRVRGPPVASPRAASAGERARRAALPWAGGRR